MVLVWESVVQIIPSTGDGIVIMTNSSNGSAVISSVPVSYTHLNNKITGTVNPSDGATYTVTLTVDGDRMTGEVTVSQGGQTMKGKIELKRVS